MAYSLCRDDAEDALSNAYLIALRCRDRLRPETAKAWFRVVVKHEAMAIRRSRIANRSLEDMVEGEAFQPTCPSTSPDVAAERREFADAVARALLYLKPDEATGLLESAAGFTYDEISDRHGWSHTKTNKMITRGRRAMRDATGVAFVTSD